MPIQVDTPNTKLSPTDAIVVALVNNMPDAALQATESQFATLLDAASGLRPVVLRLTHIAEVPRESPARAEITARYWPIERIFEDTPDALIVTGTEPRAARLEAEPYWARLEQLAHWTSDNCVSSIWSCLAAHAAVLALDGIHRRRLPEKRFGVFEYSAVGEADLLDGVGPSLVTPHSRWNNLSTEELSAAGYTIASAAPDGEVDIFLREDRGLLVCFQGHPEYERTTLLKEYRRDVARFLRGERPDWPSAPSGYFSREGCRLLQRFRQFAESRRDPKLLAQFPLHEAAADLHAPWQPGATRIYGNWLDHVAETRTGAHSRRELRV
jgi:homoserine O-succinyltransferase